MIAAGYNQRHRLRRSEDCRSPENLSHRFQDQKLLLEICYPAEFSSTQELEKWLSAHSNVPEFSQAKDKDAHGILCKIKII